MSAKLHRKHVGRLINDIEAEVRFTRHITGKDTLNPTVMQAMREVPRYRFVPDDMVSFAYFNGPLSIGNRQTISQPFIVALMTELLEVNQNSTVLEIGTGSGYQTAVLAHLVKRVYSVEIITSLAKRAHQTFEQLNYTNIETITGDGYFGWEEHAPYDAIIITAAAQHVPPPLIEQLKPNCNLVMPKGHPRDNQQLVVLRKENSGVLKTNTVLPVAFVPFTRSEPQLFTD